MRAVSIGLVCAFLVSSEGAKAGTQRAARATGTALTVHEWGTFTSMVGQGGAAIVWRPLNQASDLPSFVYVPTRRRKADIPGSVRMETPVLYFYGNEKATVSVRVGFPDGRITEWYPRASNRRGKSIRWGRVGILPGAHVSFPAEAAPSHYYPARETDAAPVSVRTATGQRQYEKFLFYRGVGSFDLPLLARVDGARVRVQSTGTNPIANVVLFESRGGQIGYGVHRLGDGENLLDRPVPGEQTVDALEHDLEALLVAEGLYEREAAAMVATWRATWSADGLRVLYIVPRSFTDAVLPISIAPPPASLVRVLVGRAELLSPEAEQALRDGVAP